MYQRALTPDPVTSSPLFFLWTTFERYWPLQTRNKIQVLEMLYSHHSLALVKLAQILRLNIFPASNTSTLRRKRSPAPNISQSLKGAMMKRESGLFTYVTVSEGYAWSVYVLLFLFDKWGPIWATTQSAKLYACRERRTSHDHSEPTRQHWPLRPLRGRSTYSLRGGEGAQTKHNYMLSFPSLP